MDTKENLQAVLISLTFLKCRNNKGAVFCFAFGPSLRDCLYLCIKAQTFHTVLIGIAEGRAFPAAKAVISDGDRDGYIYADHANFDAVCEFTRCAAILRKDSNAISVLVF